MNGLSDTVLGGSVLQCTLRY